MQIKEHTFKKFSDTLIRFGEASIAGSVAIVFIKDFSSIVSIFGLISGVILLLGGLVILNRLKS